MTTSYYVVDEAVLEEDGENGEVVFCGSDRDGAEACSGGVLQYCAEVCVERHCDVMMSVKVLLCALLRR